MVTVYLVYFDDTTCDRNVLFRFFVHFHEQKFLSFRRMGKGISVTISLCAFPTNSAKCRSRPSFFTPAFLFVYRESRWKMSKKNGPRLELFFQSRPVLPVYFFIKEWNLNYYLSNSTLTCLCRSPAYFLRLNISIRSSKGSFLAGACLGCSVAGAACFGWLKGSNSTA